MGLSINKNNYLHYKEVAQIVFEEMDVEEASPLRPEERAMGILNTWEQHGLSLARRGLQEGLRDAISSLRYCRPETLANMDSRLKAKGLPGIHALQAIVRDTLKKVLKRGDIKNPDEFYVVKELMDDIQSGLAEADRETLRNALAAFESRPRAR